ncbi:hypothetical protein GCM10010495_22720 [Kitasatospora herbaricolor]|nr:hypothetical protein GCM10010495_22720 [Kitasatospora herbaricolor]
MADHPLSSGIVYRVERGKPRETHPWLVVAQATQVRTLHQPPDNGTAPDLRKRKSGAAFVCPGGAAGSPGCRPSAVVRADGVEGRRAGWGGQPWAAVKRAETSFQLTTSHSLVT